MVVEGKQQIPGSPQFLICNFLGANKGQFEVDLHIVWWPDWYPPPPLEILDPPLNNHTFFFGGGGGGGGGASMFLLCKSPLFGVSL